MSESVRKLKLLGIFLLVMGILAVVYYLVVIVLLVVIYYPLAWLLGPVAAQWATGIGGFIFFLWLIWRDL
jgi:hypothetical protein